MKKAVVIGAGIGGIATAIRLSRLGFKVHVYEQSYMPGGKCTQFEMDGYRFDKGPSLFTLPEVMKELFELCGEEMNAHFEYDQLDPICKYFFEDGLEFTSCSNIDEQVKNMAQVFQEDENRVRDFFRDSKFIYETTAPIFMNRPLHLKHLWRTKTFWKGIGRLPFLPLRGNLQRQLKRYFKNEKTIQYFSRYATYNGSSPYATPAMMQLMPHVEHGIGAFIQKRGMFFIPYELSKLAERNGVEFHYGMGVREIVLDKQKVSGIRLWNQSIIAADLVVSNMDVHGTYKQLLPSVKAPEKWLNQEKSSSALIFYWGMNRTFDQLNVHNIFFARDYRLEFKCLFEDKTLHEDLTVYIHITSKHIAADAPQGCENWFVMVNAPCVSEQNWENLEKKARKLIVEKLERMLDTTIEEHIVCERIWNPEGIQRDTSSHLGALYGNASNSAYSAFQRHANVSQEIKNLYFVGGSVHPGGGVPLAMLSAKMVEQHILAHE
ncbi:MAG: 1-hydroxycarotenoid 3,4-desaturase CrtD [Bacteroidota bacterium]